MKIFLINIETNEAINVYDNITEWGYNFIEFNNNNNGRGKTYCNEDEYFTDTLPEEATDEYRNE